jgi:hypothetical protein
MASSEGRILGKRGKEIGCFTAKYVMIGMGYGKHSVCRHVMIAAAFLPPKPFPEAEVDHINRNKHDDRLCNLRWASRYDQMVNREKLSHSGNTYKGVKWLKPHEKSGGVNGRWRASFQYQKQVHINHFKTEEEAVEWLAAKKAEVIKSN